MNGDEILVVDPFNGDDGALGSYASGSYAVNPTVSRQFSENYGNPKNNKYTLTAVPGQTIRLTTVDGQVLYEGSGEEAVNKAADIVDAMNKAYGPGATWKLQTKSEGASDFTTVSQDTVAKQKKTALNSFLDVALPLAGGLLVPGLGLLGGVAGAAAGAGGASLLNSALQSQSLDDAIKTALINAAAAGAGNYVGGQISGALQGVGGAGDALARAEGALINAGGNFANSGALDALAQSFGQGVGSVAGSVAPVVITAGTQGLGTALGTGLGSVLAGGALSGGSSAVDPITVTPNQPTPVTPVPGVGGGTGGTTVVDPITVTPNQPSTETPTVPVTPPTGNVVDSVTVQPKPGTVLQDLGAGAGTIIAGAGGTILWQPPTPNVVDPITVTPPPSQPTTPVVPYVPPTEPITNTVPSVNPTTPSNTDWTDALPVVGGLIGGASGGSSGTSYTSPTWSEGTRPGQPGSLSDVFRGTLPTTNLDMTQRDMSGTDWKRYGFGPEKSFFVNVPEQNFAKGGYAVRGPGTGRSDSIKANLSDGEYVVDAETVALLGDGSSKAGARKLDELRVKVRKAKGRDLAKGKFSVKAHAPEHYMRGGRS